MKKAFVIIAILTCILMFSSVAQVGKSILNMDGTASKWTVGKENANNVAVVSDVSDDKVEGTGSLKVTVALRVLPNSWGTWTDISYAFPAPINLTGADDIRFKMKILQKPATLKVGKPPSYSRALQFTFDINEAQGDLWRYNEDLDIFYTPHRNEVAADGWFEFVIPIKSLRFPTWAASKDGIVNLDSIKSIAFGVHSDSTAADSIVFLMDDIRATKATKVGSTLVSFDGSASKFALDKQVPTNKFVLSDVSDDMVEGTGSLKVDVALRTMGASWGTWTDASLTLSPPLNVDGATELRFWMKVLAPTKWKKGCQFSLDLKDTSGFFFRWVNGGYYGLFIRKNDNPTIRDGWFEVVIPLNDMLAPSWNPPKYPDPLLKAINGIGFGVHNDSTASDSVTLLFDNLHATKAGNLTSVKREKDAVISGFELEQNYPNPFNPSTTIKYTLNSPGLTTLKVVDVLGRVVKTVVDQHQTAGSYTATVDMSGHTSSVYFYVLEQGGNRRVQKMMLVK